MSQYKFFATVYDRMMDNIPYEEWKQFLLLLMYRYGVKPESKIAEIGCGTGTMTRLLAEDGFKMTGIDLSEDMLKIACEKGCSRAGSGEDSCKNNRCIKSCGTENADEENECEISYLRMDMRELKLPEKQDVIISICDSMNYLLNTEDLYRTISAARNNLKDGGLLIFDLKTEYFYKYILDGYTDRENLGDFSYVWKNIYDQETKIHKYFLKFKYAEKDPSGRKIYREVREVHRQRAFSAADIRKAAERAGFDHAAVFGGSCQEKPRVNSERIFVCLQCSATVGKFTTVQKS